jgi:AcrR family transcriptional regulator
MATSARTRLTAAERREDVLAAAIAEFARTGYHGTPTEAIAKRAGISQPYLFRLYGTKKGLFLACLERCFDRTRQTFEQAAARLQPGETPFRAMGRAYKELLADRELLLFQLQTYAAADDDDIRDAARRRYEALREDVRRLAGGAADADVLPFFGQGMLLNVAAALELDPQQWIWTRPPGEPEA